jgi:hypothetical protein
MSKEIALKHIRKKFDAKTSEIEKEYDKKIKELETKLFYKKKEKNARLAKAEKQFRKDSVVFFKGTVGQEDYSWLNEWLMKNKEKEIKEVAKRHETKQVNKIKKMSTEDYLFYYFNNPKVEERLKKEMEQNKSEEAKRLSSILAKLKVEYLRLQRTSI